MSESKKAAETSAPQTADNKAAEPKKTPVVVSTDSSKNGYLAARRAARANGVKQ